MVLFTSLKMVMLDGPYLDHDGESKRALPDVGATRLAARPTALGVLGAEREIFPRHSALRQTLSGNQLTLWGKALWLVIFSFTP